MFRQPPEEDRGRLIFCPCKRYTAQGSPPKLPMTPTDLLSKVVRRLATACAYGSGQQSFVNELLAGTARENIQYLGDVFLPPMDASVSPEDPSPPYAPA